MVAEPGDETMETMEARLQAVSAELTGIINMNIPTFTRTIDARVQTMEGTVGSIMNIERVVDENIEEKVKAQITSQRGNWTGKLILECKAILDLKPINDAKGYRVWNKKLKNAFDQARPRSREVINWLESVREKKVIEAKGKNLDETMASWPRCKSS